MNQVQININSIFQIFTFFFFFIVPGTIFSIAYHDTKHNRKIDNAKYKATHKEAVPKAATLLNSGCSVSIGKVGLLLKIVSFFQILHYILVISSQ